jgi:hypothetical protein
MNDDQIDELARKLWQRHDAALRFLMERAPDISGDFTRLMVERAEALSFADPSLCHRPSQLEYPVSESAAPLPPRVFVIGEICAVQRLRLEFRNLLSALVRSLFDISLQVPERVLTVLTALISLSSVIPPSSSRARAFVVSRHPSLST